MLRWGALLMLLGIVGVSTMASGQDETNDYPQLIVHVYNDAGIPDRVLRRAERETFKVFRDAGVHLEWGRPVEKLGVSAGESDLNGLALTLAVRIVPKSRTLAGEVFGVAFLGPDGVGQQADVFYDNVVSFSRESSRNAGEVLGYVIAHELGHLLLGSNSHAPVGLMQGHWSSDELKKMSMGQLRFEPEQTARVRNRVLAEANRPTTEIRAANSSYPLP